MKSLPTCKYFNELTHKITIAVIGTGGTGSHMVNSLCRINKALTMLNHPGLYVHAYDYKNVSHHNIGRQLFFPSDIGKNKATTIISRANRSYGLNWIGYDRPFIVENANYNILITCTDTVDLRIEIDKFLRQREHYHGNNASSYYWMDIGNSKLKGQIYLGDFGKVIPGYIETFPTVIEEIENIDPPLEGCSTFTTFNSQELFINEFLVNIAAHMLYMIIRNKVIEYNLVFANLETLNIQKQLWIRTKSS